jgi:hypothetical protein
MQAKHDEGIIIRDAAYNFSKVSPKSQTRPGVAPPRHGPVRQVAHPPMTVPTRPTTQVSANRHGGHGGLPGLAAARVEGG